jgi:ATP-binding cassette subfamily F protein 2
LDEPTNHLDMESIDALGKAVNEYDGGLILVSHDMRLISQVAKEIWICENKTITKYRGDIMNFKMDMRAQMGIDEVVKLKGDASVKATDKPKKEKPKPQPKLEVITPVVHKVKSIPEERPVVVAAAPPTAPPPPPKAAEPADDATAVTASTTATSDSGDSSGAAAAAPKSRYVPPHLRKKMAQG